MPTLVTITRGAAAPKMRRGDVPTKAVFLSADGKKKCAALGMNGRAYSVNLDTHELASSANDDAQVTLVGTWDFDVNRQYVRDSRIGQEMNRSDVAPGEMFQLVRGHEEYLHIGRVNKSRNGWLSIPFARQQNHAIADAGHGDGTTRVVVTGTFQIKATLAA